MIIALGALHFFEDGLEAFLELAAKLRAGDQRAHVERDDLLVLQTLRHVAAHDALGQAFDDRGLAHAGLADQHRVVLGSAREHLDHAADLFVAADHRIEFSLRRQLGQIAAVFLERFVGCFGILRGHALAAPDLLQRPHHAIAGDAEVFEDFLFGRRQQHMLDGDVVVLEPLGLVFGAVQQVLQAGGDVDLIEAARSRSGDARQLIQLLGQRAMDILQLDPGL